MLLIIIKNQDLLTQDLRVDMVFLWRVPYPLSYHIFIPILLPDHLLLRIINILYNTIQIRYLPKRYLIYHIFTLILPQDLLLYQTTNIFLISIMIQGLHIKVLRMPMLSH